jgi:hypothetical protein
MTPTPLRRTALLSQKGNLFISTLIFDGMPLAPVLHETRQLKWNNVWIESNRRSRIKLYQAVAEPIYMNTSTIPEFYKDILQGVDLGSLENIMDRDFFEPKRVFTWCYNLRALEVSTSDPSLFK